MALAIANSPGKSQCPVDETADVILSQVLKTRIQRKAKGVIRSGINYLISTLVLFSSTSDVIIAKENIYEGAYILWKALMSSGFGILIALSDFYVMLLCIFLFLHATTFPFDRHYTTRDVEKAYDRTNQYPAIDGILELGFPAKFKEKYWQFSYVILGISTSFIASGAVLYAMNFEHTSSTTTSALVATMVLLFQISADFSEYWVYTRHQRVKSSEDGSGNTELMINAGKLA